MGCPALTYHPSTPLRVAHRGKSLTPENTGAGSQSAYRWGFGGQLKDDEVYGATGTSYTAEFWQYDPRTGRRWNIDPVITPSLSAYHTFELNPIWKVDPKGNRADEFDSDGNKISNLGGDKIDFFHQKDGNTKVVDRASGASNMITGGEGLIRGYTQRDAGVGPGTIGLEWDQGSGPAKSMFASFDGEQTGPFGSLRDSQSSYGGRARREALGSGLGKDNFALDYSEANPFAANDMWEQMLGRTNISWYKLGDQVMYLMNDSKSWESFLYRLIPESWNYERSPSFSKNGNTYQTYIWTESLTQAKRHTDIIDAANQRALEMQMLNRQRPVPFGPK